MVVEFNTGGEKEILGDHHWSMLCLFSGLGPHATWFNSDPAYQQAFLNIAEMEGFQPFGEWPYSGIPEMQVFQPPGHAMPTGSILPGLCIPHVHLPNASDLYPHRQLGLPMRSAIRPRAQGPVHTHRERRPNWQAQATDATAESKVSEVDKARTPGFSEAAVIELAVQIGKRIAAMWGSPPSAPLYDMSGRHIKMNDQIIPECLTEPRGGMYGSQFKMAKTVRVPHLCARYLPVPKSHTLVSLNSWVPSSLLLIQHAFLLSATVCHPSSSSCRRELASSVRTCCSCICIWRNIKCAVSVLWMFTQEAGCVHSAFCIASLEAANACACSGSQVTFWHC